MATIKLAVFHAMFGWLTFRLASRLPNSHFFVEPTLSELPVPGFPGNFQLGRPRQLHENGCELPPAAMRRLRMRVFDTLVPLRTECL